MKGVGVLFMLIGLTAYSQSEVNVAFLEEKQGSYLQTEAQKVELDQSTFVSTATALLNLATLTDVTPLQSKQISAIVKASPFDSANALLILTITGANQVELLEASQLQATGTDDLLTGVALLKQANSIAEQIQLDTSNMAGCGEACLEQLLMDANEDLSLSANYSSVEAPLKGSWSFKTSEGIKIALNLEEVSDRLFALEVASYWAAVKDAVAQKQLRTLQQPGVRFEPQILTRAFISPSMIKQAYGSSSQQYQTAVHILRKMIAASIQRLQAASGGRLVTAVISLDEVNEAQENGLWALTVPSSSFSVSRRKLLASEGDTEYLNNFIAWVAMWGTFFLLLFFALTGCHCLKSMKFKQDSLLYGKNKSE